MGTANMNFDLGRIMDEVFGVADKVSERLQTEMDKFPFKDGKWNAEGMDYYPSYHYPPMNVYLTTDKSLVFEFALAGFRQEDLTIKYQGDYMHFSANYPKDNPEVTDSLRYLKKRLKFKSISDQKYFVPVDKFDQEKTVATYSNGLLKVVVPSKEIVEEKEGIKVEIRTESDGTIAKESGK